VWVFTRGGRSAEASNNGPKQKLLLAVHTMFLSQPHSNATNSAEDFRTCSRTHSILTKQLPHPLGGEVMIRVGLRKYIGTTRRRGKDASW
jgi:hypothetical protein